MALPQQRTGDWTRVLLGRRGDRDSVAVVRVRADGEAVAVGVRGKIRHIHRHRLRQIELLLGGTGGFVDPQTGRERRIKLEVSSELKHGEAGGVAMARSQDPNSASSQFYITLGPAAFLDMNYAFFGRVVDGLDAAKQLRAGDQMKTVKLAE